MKWLKDMLSGKKQNAVDLLQQIVKRAEKLTPEEQAKSFVSIRRMDGALKSRDNRVIFGRRGTGKTHFLSYMASQASQRGEIACVIDLRRVGSNNSIYSDQSIPASARATTLIRDFISAIHTELMGYYTDPKTNFKDNNFIDALNGLNSCIKKVLVTEVQENRISVSSNDIGSAIISGDLNLSLSNTGLKLNAKGDLSSNDANAFQSTQTGKPRLSINMGDAFVQVERVCRLLKNRFWVMLDEWSSIPETLQPYLADFIRRAILPVQEITVCIAAIEYRSKFQVFENNERIGLELGSDISADINLDDYFIYDISPDGAVQFFRELLFKHLTAMAGSDGLLEKSSEQVVSNVFSQDRVFEELVRASEGVARDFINIVQVAVMRAGESTITKITMNEIRAAAKDWFETDKQRNLDTRPNASALLEWIRDKVIQGKKARAFLLDAGSVHPLIEFLFDERVLHIAKRSYSAKDNPGTRYRVWKIDYGCYVDLINTINNPSNFLEAGFEIVSEDINVPDDDYRAVRRAILNIDEFDQSYYAE